MMGGLDYCNSRFVSLCIFCIFIAFQSACAQQGFLSINCCADSNTSDPNSNISWITDENWYPSKKGCRNISRPVQNETDSNKARFFGSKYSTKWCYNLTTTNGQDYLIRGTFLFGDVQRTTTPGTFFDALIGVTKIGRVNSSNDYEEIEGIFRASDEYTNFCLLREKGDPYISKLELRPVSTEYLTSESSDVLKVVHRVNIGSLGPDIRYPDDPYDRIWRPKLNPEQVSNFVNATANLTIANSSTLLPPIKVLQTAQTDPERLEFVHEDLQEGYNYELYLYFLELNNSVQAGQRVFDIYINNKKEQQIDILGGGSSYREVVLNFTTNGVFNLTMIKSSNISQLGPICNAYEILQIQPEVQGTAKKDVDVIAEVRNELMESNRDNEMLKSWSGDPCLPFPWHGLQCESSNGSSIITKMDISLSKLQGPLPLSITKLTHLMILNMSNNGFTSTIPEFPASSTLISVDLSHNDLMGKIPESLASLPYLITLYFGCNRHFSKELPPNFKTSRIKTDKEGCSEKGSTRLKPGIIIGTVAGGFILIIVAIGIYFTFFYKKKVMMAKGKFDTKGYPVTKNAIYSIPSMDDIVLKSISIHSFSLENIEAATQHYKTLIGEGGFGSVYRGTLSDGQEVAVKVRSSTSTQGTREFDNELTLLSTIRHENLVPLLGYCCESDQQILVYPFMSNGSLQDRLYGEAAKRKILDWPTRLSIALGAARGLTYLHTFSERCVIHRDVKSSNILLDQSMCAKVADFGFSKYAPQEGDSGASLEIRGTAGYLDPEYYSTQHLSAKSDVFSFGVVLLELISGREPLNIRRPRNEWSLVEWAKPYIRNSRIEEIVDPGIKGGYHAEALWRVVEVALACIEPFSAYRPCMVDIVRELEDALIIENNASEYMKSIDSFGGSNRFSIERPSVIIIPPTPTPTEASTILSQQPSPPQPR